MERGREGWEVHAARKRLRPRRAASEQAAGSEQAESRQTDPDPELMSKQKDRQTERQRDRRTGRPERCGVQRIPSTDIHASR